MSITVYSASSCVQCKATYRALEQQNISYTVINVDETLSAREELKKLGHRQLPVVVAGDQHWSGFQPDRIKAL
ncbi:glutaredoxin-like protein NrdH [Vreelandella massiliensis]|uniref:glutaredoxin-like protein NrdH n=1 Tax=Vreelandella massiliensis TaxID=1816686 RepID=UPI00096ABEC1|nr:glutaredoxin-like protein NrdH [Halomonas massiliensis]MYL24484.1 glutaredoxin-like protein NrdH [Halomonas alkaliantarctica]